MTARLILASLMMLVTASAWAQGESTPTTMNPANSAPAPQAPAATETPATSDATQPATTDTMSNSDEEAGGNTSGPVTSTDKIVDRFMALDTDKSEGVSFDEYMTMVQQRAQDRFDGMDANHDGEVTADEFRKFWQERMAQWYRLKR